jgi:electron transfer flavoprotein alpha subunit
VSVLCLVEPDGAAIAAASLRAVVLARALAGGDGVTAVLFAAGADPDADAAIAAADPGLLAELAASGASALCLVAEAGYAPAGRARALQQLAADGPAAAVVAAATDRGGEVLAHLGAMTGLPVAANCVSAAVNGPGRWQLIRQRWAGSVLEEAELEAPCALLTVAADGVPPEAVAAGIAAARGGAGDPVSVRSFRPELEPADLQVTATESAAEAGGVSLATARVVIGGGRGVGGPEGFAVLEELAALLGGVVGVSRVVTSQGWRPHRQQVGQTGTRISPELYLACGISGAIQHMAGCQGARHIVVINTDPDAPIISRAEYAVIGDLAEVIPALVEAIRNRPG